MNRLIFDIETIGEDFSSMDDLTKELISKRAKKESEGEEDFNEKLNDITSGFALSPLTGEIVTIGVLDIDSMKGGVYFQAGESDIQPLEINGIKLIPMTEKEMLIRFWEIAARASEFIGFNSRAFDAPFIITRSAINNVSPSIDLMPDRYGRFGIKHIDLYDQLSFYGASRFAHSSLHMWCRALQIVSPKINEVKGEDVSSCFKEKKYLEIAKYNMGDLIATKELYDYWLKYFKFS